MTVTLVLAMARNGVIGRDGGLPWRLPTDMKRFKADTMGKPVVMGRRTWESFPRRPLPGRLNIVVTRDRAFRAEGAVVVHSLEEALARAGDADGDEICVIGGGQIYRQALPLADRLNGTHVMADVAGDVRFPDIDPGAWKVVASEEWPAGEADSHPMVHTVYERR